MSPLPLDTQGAPGRAQLKSRLSDAQIRAFLSGLLLLPVFHDHAVGWLLTDLDFETLRQWQTFAVAGTQAAICKDSLLCVS